MAVTSVQHGWFLPAFPSTSLGTKWEEGSSTWDEDARVGREELKWKTGPAAAWATRAPWDRIHRGAPRDEDGDGDSNDCSARQGPARLSPLLR